MEYQPVNTIYTIIEESKHVYYVEIDEGKAIPIEKGPFYSLKDARKWIKQDLKNEYPKVIEKYNDKGELV